LKHPRRLKRRHKEYLTQLGYDAKEWLLVKDTTELLQIVHRASGEVRQFEKDKKISPSLGKHTTLIIHDWEGKSNDIAKGRGSG